MDIATPHVHHTMASSGSKRNAHAVPCLVAYSLGYEKFGKAWHNCYFHEIGSRLGLERILLLR